MKARTATPQAGGPTGLDQDTASGCLLRQNRLDARLPAEFYQIAVQMTPIS